MIKFTLTFVEHTEKRSKLLRRTNFITAADRLKDDWMFGEYSVNLFSMSFEVQSELLYWPCNGLCVGKSSESAESPWTVTKKSEKSRKMFTVPAAMFEMGGKPRFHVLDPGFGAQFCFAILYFFLCLFSLSLFLSLFSFLIVCASFCFGVDFFGCFYLALSVASHSVALRDGNSPEACETFKKQVYHLAITQQSPKV